MNAEDEFRFLRRFVDWLAGRGVALLTDADIYEFLGQNR